MDRKRFILIFVTGLLLVIIGVYLLFKMELRNKPKNPERITTTTKVIEKIEYPITNETLLCESSVCEPIEVGNFTLQVKNMQLYLNGIHMFHESGKMYDDQLYFEITMMDENNLFFDVTFAGEHMSQYVIGTDGKESIVLSELSDFEFYNAKYDGKYIIIYSTSQKVMDILYKGNYCNKISSYDNSTIVKKEERYKYLGNGRIGEKEIVKEQTTYDTFLEFCTTTN